MALYTNNIKGSSYNLLQSNSILNLMSVIEVALFKTNTDIQVYNEIQNLISSIRRDVKKLVIDGEELISRLESIFFESINVGATTLDSYKFHENLFNTDISPKFEIISVNRELTYINLSLVTQSVNLYALSNAAINLTGISFSNASEINDILSSISSQYTSIINRNRYTKLNQEQLELVEIDAQVSDQVADTVALLQAAQISLPKQQIVQVTRNSLIPLTYKYYGNVDLRGTLAKVNRLQSVLDIRGEFKVLAV